MDISNKITLPSFDSFHTEAGAVGAHLSSYDAIMSVVKTVQNTVFEWVWRDAFSVSLLLSMALLIVILYVSIRTKQVREIEDAKYANSPLSSAGSALFHSTTSVSQDNTSTQTKRWKEIILHVQSSSATNWRQAIIEADIMLDSAITGKGYFGESLGEKMKQVSKGDINSIDDAWEAHKVRNKIAHDGSDYDLNQREARRVIGLYENVFNELGYIDN